MIEVRNLVFKYNTHIILDDLTFTLNDDETTVVIGRSGVGKSTLVRCILGLAKPDSGSILVDGTDRIGFVDGGTACHAGVGHRCQRATSGMQIGRPITEVGSKSDVSEGHGRIIVRDRRR